MTYYFQDSMGVVLAAARDWTANSGSGTATETTLLQQFAKAYGTNNDCAPVPDSTALRRWRYWQWHTAGFTVQLMETPMGTHPGHNAPAYVV